MPTAQLRPAGTILPSRFVKEGTTANTVVAAGAGDLTIGISQEGTRNPPYDLLDDGNAALSGEPMLVYQFGDICWIESGAAILMSEPRLKSGTAGVGIPVTTDGDKYGAIALQPASASGQLIQVRVVQGERAS